MPQTRIVTVALAPLFVDLLRRISPGADLEIVGPVARREMLASVRSEHADVVLLGADAGDPEQLAAVLRTHHPHVRVVAIDEEQTRAIAYEPCPRPYELHDMSDRSLLDLLRCTRP